MILISRVVGDITDGKVGFFFFSLIETELFYYYINFFFIFFCLFHSHYFIMARQMISNDKALIFKL